MRGPWTGKKKFWCDGRLPLYIAGFGAAAAIDPLTPTGSAEWLIAVALVCLAVIRGGQLEMIVVAAVGSVSTLVGIWTSPSYAVSLWLEMLNRLGAIGVIWAAVYLAHRRRVAEAQVKILRGLLPICASCKRIRSADDHWNVLESYISDHSEAMFSHGLCPECFATYYAELEKTQPAKS